jgi:hypothetical protein
VPVAVVPDAVGAPGADGGTVSGVEVPPAFSAAQYTSHASAEFQLIVTSFSDQASMSSR